MSSHILSLLIFIPAAGALLMLIGHRFISSNGNSEDSGKTAVFHKWIAVIFTGLQLFLSIWLWVNYVPGGGIQYQEHHAWIQSFNIEYFLGVDGLSLPLIVLTALLSFIGVVSSWNIKKSVLGYFSLLLLLDTAMMGVFCSLDFFLFYVFWELMLLPMYFLIGIWGGPQRMYAAIKFFLYTLLGSVLMLLAMLALYFYTEPHTFNLIAMIQSGAAIRDTFWGMDIRMLIFVALFIGFAIKVPIVPFHTWLPLAHVEAPTAVSVILAGVLLKMGTYGLLRINYPLLPDQVYIFAWSIALLGVINIIWGALNAIAQIDLKKMVAYSSVSHMGYVLLGMAAVVSTSAAGSQAGINGAVMQMFNHGTITAMLFLLVGIIYEKVHHRYIFFPKDYKDPALAGKLAFGGLAGQLPVYSGFVALAFFAGLGLPALSGFISEAMCFIGGFSIFRTLTIIGTLGILLNAIYFLRSYMHIFLGPVSNAYEGLKDMNGRELLTIVPLAIIVIALGVYPRLMLDVISPTMNSLIKLVQDMALMVGIN